MTKEKATSPEKKAALEAIRAQSNGVASRAQADRLLEALRLLRLRRCAISTCITARRA